MDKERESEKSDPLSLNQSDIISFAFRDAAGHLLLHIRNVLYTSANGCAPETINEIVEEGLL